MKIVKASYITRKNIEKEPCESKLLTFTQQSETGIISKLFHLIVVINLNRIIWIPSNIYYGKLKNNV